MLDTDSTFVYDEMFTADSEVVNAAFYNAHGGTVTVVLNNDGAYVYSVPHYVWEAFKATTSKGRFYNLTLKRDYGPGEFVGVAYADEFEHRETASEQPTAAVGTPKGLTYADNAVVDGVRLSDSVFSPGKANTATGGLKSVNLFSSELRNTTRRFAVDFKSDGRVRTHTLDAESFGAAENAVLEIGAMLDLEFEVVGVKVIE